MATAIQRIQQNLKSNKVVAALGLTVIGLAAVLAPAAVQGSADVSAARAADAAPIAPFTPALELSVSHAASVVPATLALNATTEYQPDIETDTTPKLDPFSETIPALFFGRGIFGSQTYTQNTAIDETVLPAANGDDVNYTLTPALPAGLSFDPATRAITGTPSAAAGGIYTYTATDGNTSASLTFNISIEAGDQQPITVPLSFGRGVLGSQSFTLFRAIDALTLPATTGGAGETTYTLTPALPAGVVFDTASRTISGTPTESADGTYTYTAINGADSITLRFNIEVQPDN